MKNIKGQALVEFVLLLPIILLIIFTSMDIFNLVLTKNDLNNELSDKIKLLDKKKITLDEFKNSIDDTNINIEKKDDFIKIKASKEVSWISPMTELVLSNYTISIERMIPYE